MRLLFCLYLIVFSSCCSTTAFVVLPSRVSLQHSQPQPSSITCRHYHSGKQLPSTIGSTKLFQTTTNGDINTIPVEPTTVEPVQVGEITNLESVADCDPYDPEGSNYCTVDPDTVAAATTTTAAAAWQRRVRLATLFALWYILNVGYNIGNKSVLNALPIPWTAATIELFFGFPYVAMLWLCKLRPTPKLSWGNIRTLSSQAFFLAATHVLGVISFGAGAISFTHIVKATEPVWSAVILGVFFREILPIPVYLSLIPIIGGVGLASLKELSFTWLSFSSGLLSAVTSASKAILSKKVLSGKPLGENLSPTNMFAVLTILGFFMILPASLYMEGPTKVSAAFSSALAAGYTKPQLFRLLSASGFLYYLYNEVAFLALSEVAPVTHAVANTVKRVVIILASVLVFRNPVSRLGALGSAMAIAGATAYSIAKSNSGSKSKKESATTTTTATITATAS
jgi:solute carrier family 35, member E1